MHLFGIEKDHSYAVKYQDTRTCTQLNSWVRDKFLLRDSFYSLMFVVSSQCIRLSAGRVYIYIYSAP